MTIAVSFVRDAVIKLYEEHGPKPPADLVQEILDGIESIEDDRTRCILFATAKQHITGALRDLLISARARSNRRWGVVPN